MMEPCFDAPEGAAEKWCESTNDDRRLLAVCLPADRPARSPGKQSARDRAPAVDGRAEAENHRPETADAERALREPHRAQGGAANLVPVETFELCRIQLASDVDPLDRVDRPVVVLDAQALDGAGKFSGSQGG